MQRAVRSSVTAGVAFIGAGVIAASPIAPPVPDIQLPAIHVDATTLAAAVSPIDAYRQVFETAAANIQALVDSADPGEVLKQIVANQVAGFTDLGDSLGTAGEQLFTALTATTPDLLKTVFTSLAAGNVEAASNALLTVPLAVGLPLISLLPAIQKFVTQPFQNLINATGVLSDPLQDGLYAVGLLGPVISGLGATGTAIQNVIDAVGAGNPQMVADAILTGPATIIDGLLNGGYGPDLGPLVGPGLTVLAGGLFTTGGISIGPTGDIVLNVAGPIATLQTLAHQIAVAIKPPSATSAAAVKAKALPASSSPVDPSATTDTAVTTDGSAASTGQVDPVKVGATSKVAAKSVRHKPAAASATKSGPKSAHKAHGRGHSAR